MATFDAFFGRTMSASAQARQGSIAMPSFAPKQVYTDTPITSEQMTVTIDYDIKDAEAAANKVIQSLNAEIKKLHRVLESKMTDEDTMIAARAIATVEALLDDLESDHPKVPEAKAKEIEQLVEDVNALAKNLKERRTYYVVKSKVHPAIFADVVKRAEGTDADPEKVLDRELKKIVRGESSDLVSFAVEESKPYKEPIPDSAPTPFYREQWKPLQQPTQQPTPTDPPAPDKTLQSPKEKPRFPIAPVAAIGAGILATYLATR